MKRKKAEFEFEESDDAAGSRTRPLRADVLAADDAFYVVNKPAGMFFDEGLFDEPSVIEQLAEGGDEESPRSVVPLEPEVSGIMLLARDEATASEFAAQLASQSLVIRYMALVRGIVMQDSGVLEGAVTNPRGGRVKVVTTGDPARTDWQLRDRFIGFALLDCVPRTAFEQQIRAHLAHAGLPLAVDSVHGGASELKLSSFKGGYRPSRRHPERPLIRRPTLHARSISFSHPRTGERIELEAPLPKDFKATLHQLDRFGRISK